MARGNEGTAPRGVFLPRWGYAPRLLDESAAADVTVRKLYDERWSLLLHQLDHRVNNTLSAAQSMAMQTLRDGTMASAESMCAGT